MSSAQKFRGGKMHSVGYSGRVMPGGASGEKRTWLSTFPEDEFQGAGYGDIDAYRASWERNEITLMPGQGERYLLDGAYQKDTDHSYLYENEETF